MTTALESLQRIRAARYSSSAAYAAWLARSVSVRVMLGGVAVIVTGDDPDGCVRIRYEASGQAYAESLSETDRITIRMALAKALAGRKVA